MRNDFSYTERVLRALPEGRLGAVVAEGGQVYAELMARFAVEGALDTARRYRLLPQRERSLLDILLLRAERRAEEGRDNRLQDVQTLIEQEAEDGAAPQEIAANLEIAEAVVAGYLGAVSALEAALRATEEAPRLRRKGPKVPADGG